MDRLYIKSSFLQEDVSMDHIRHLYQTIDWSDRLIGIIGARGTGKTTLLLQRLKRIGFDRREALYLSMDDIYLSTHSLADTAESFRQQGGKVLFLDEVHKYVGWAREIKNIYDTYRDLSIVFTGSSIIDIYQQEADLSRRAVFYELTGLSFREYLHFAKVHHGASFTLDRVLHDHTALALSLSKEFRPLQHFRDYLDHGYYPFFAENLKTYHLRLEQVVRLVLETELRFIEGFDFGNSGKITRLLVILAENVPFKPNISKLSEKIGLSRPTLVQYLHYLGKARLISLLSAAGNSISTLQKPEKIYLENPNLHKTLASEEPNKGSRRVSFFLSQLRNAGHEVSLPVKSDFLVDNKYTFEIGGQQKNRKQMQGIPDAHLALDDIETGFGNKIPLWLFGFLY